MGRSGGIRGRLWWFLAEESDWLHSPANNNSAPDNITQSVSTHMRGLPKYSELPLDKAHPAGSAWGLWGDDDQLGTLNLLTEEVVRNAARSIRSGKRVSLNWEMSAPNPPFFQRLSLQHKVWRKEPRYVHDDEVHFNTQCSTQIDGLRHFGYHKEKVFYGGVTAEEIAEPGSTALGIHSMSRAGIVGRGVLIDYARWAEGQGLEVNEASKFPISLHHLLQAAKEQGVEEFQTGDILIVRSGYVRRLKGMSAEEIEPHTIESQAIGMEQSQEVLAFLWNNHFSMVAGDSLGFECMPTVGDLRMHEFLLAGWGMPIGELWDLEELSELCAKEKQYTFFVTSSPLNILGGVASPANAIAIL